MKVVENQASSSSKSMAEQVRRYRGGRAGKGLVTRARKKDVRERVWAKPAGAEWSALVSVVANEEVP